MMHFPGQRADEEVLQVIHKHPVVYIKIVLAFVLYFVLPILVFVFFWFRAFPLATYIHRDLIVGIFLSLYILFGLLFTYNNLTDEQFDVFIITTDRLIDITQISFFKRSVSSTSLEQIQDTTGMISGFFPTLFHYGDLTVKTSSAEGDTFFIDHIADPDGVGKHILEIARHRRKDAASQASV